MADTEKTIKELKDGLDFKIYDSTCVLLEVSTVSNALELLKNSVSQGVVDQIRWERDTALSQLKEIGKGLGEKMDDVVELMKSRDGEHE